MLDENIFFDGQKLKSKRLSLKMSQSDLAQDITTQATISLMENTSRVPKNAILLKILSRLNLDIDDLDSKNLYEQKIQKLFIKLNRNEDIYDLTLYEIDEIRSNQGTGIYQYIMDSLCYFYAKNADYFRVVENLELVVKDSQFISMNQLNQYTIYQYLALSESRLGFTTSATHYFDHMIANEPNINVIDDEQFRCILKVRSNYIEFLISNNEYQLGKHYIEETLSLCKPRFTIYLVPTFYRQLAKINENKGESDLFRKYMSCADKIDIFLNT